MDAPPDQRRARAYDNCCKAIDMHEMFERVTIRNHKSFLVHGAIYKVSRDIMAVGDVWAYNLSPLELQNAETKRTASSSGSRHAPVPPPPLRNAKPPPPPPRHLGAFEVPLHVTGTPLPRHSPWPMMTPHIWADAPW